MPVIEHYSKEGKVATVRFCSFCPLDRTLVVADPRVRLTRLPASRRCTRRPRRLWPRSSRARSGVTSLHEQHTQGRSRYPQDIR